MPPSGPGAGPLPAHSDWRGAGRPPGVGRVGHPAPQAVTSPAHNETMRIAVLAGGLGGARFVRGLRLAVPAADITVIGNTADDIVLFGLKACPDLDTLMYALGDGLDTERGWGRAEETFHAAAELAAYGAQPDWFGLGDRDLGTHLLRTQLIHAGYSLTDITAALCQRWQPGVTLLPMTDDRVETHVVVADDAGRRAIHFQEWWVRHRATLPAHDFVMVGAEEASPGPDVLAVIADADVVVLPPSNPVVSIGAIFSVPGIRDAVRTTDAPVVGVSGIISGRPLRGMADACLQAIGVDSDAAAVARWYGARPDGVLDGWLLDTADAHLVSAVEAAGIRTAAVPTRMVDDNAAAALANAALALVGVTP